ncbi:MAG TPA: ribonuclease P protein component [Spirochaetia bacterium]|nr:ribonuclease P protein component [Spirochaetia bacterium]
MRRSLTRKERIRAGRDIRRLFRTGRRVDAGGLKLLYTPNGSKINRVAFVIARGCGGAVRRNREKRITREAYRLLKERIPLGQDLLFLVSRFGSSYDERRDSMEQVLRRAGFHENAD